MIRDPSDGTVKEIELDQREATGSRAAEKFTRTTGLGPSRMESAMAPDKEDFDTIIRLFGVATTQTEITQLRRQSATEVVLAFLQKLRNEAPDADPHS